MAKSNSIKLSIQEPCSQNWNDMSQQAKGRHCSSCQQVVIDFSKHTDKELVEFFKKAKDNVCGRMTEYQLERIMPVMEKSNNSILMKAALGTALVAGIAGTASSQTVNQHYWPAALPTPDTTAMTNAAQTDTSRKNEPIVPLIDSATIDNAVQTNTVQKDVPQKKVDHNVNGIVKDARTNEPLEDVEVYVEEANGLFVTTDSAGHFEIIIPDILIGQNVTLVFCRRNHTTTTATVNTNKLPDYLKIKMEYHQEYMKMGKVAINRYNNTDVTK